MQMAASPKEIDERAFRFLCDAIEFVRKVRYEPGVRRLLDQLVASVGSIAANRAEAACASSRREFIRFNEIALRSANEAALWLRVFTATKIGDVQRAEVLLEESRQLARIVAAIVLSTRRNL
jgi:four helix bundle protein